MSREKVTFESENKAGKCPGVVEGKITQTKKGLIVLQEWWGMNEQIQNEAAELGKLGGFVTLVPDLYRGNVTKDYEEAGHMMSTLDWPGAVDDVRGAAKYLLTKGCTSVGVTGFCLGGALSLASAALVSEISAAAPFYGIPNAKLADVSTIKIPLQCHFAELDDTVGFASPKEYEALREKLKAGEVPFEFHIHQAQHAFTNATSPKYNKAACDVAFERLVKFMNDKLK